MELKTKIYLVNEKDEKFMGIGVVWLLEKVHEKGSLRSAAASLGISYSKAYTMISVLEKALGKSVLDRKKGGSSRTGATLTTFGVVLLDKYKVFHASVKEVTKAPYEEFSQEFNTILSAFDKNGEKL
jgi:molybdate transport system regulatory protein